MMVQRFLRTKDLANAEQISTQQVRNYETSGFLPLVERSPSGYRRYTRQHLAALKTARLLIDGYGWQRAQEIMQAAHRGALPKALALIDARHAELAAMRVQLDHTETALNVVATQMPSERHPHVSKGLRAGDAARQANVQVSTLRFWEQQGLLQPARERSSNYRLYNEQQVRRIRIVALLRGANYTAETIRAMLDELEAGQPQRAVAAIERRRAEIASTSWRCVQALTAFHTYVNDFLNTQV